MNIALVLYCVFIPDASQRQVSHLDVRQGFQYGTTPDVRHYFNNVTTPHATVFALCNQYTSILLVLLM